MNMKSLFVPLALAFSVTCLAQNPTASGLAGDWSGQLDVMGQKLTLVFHLSQEADSAWTATLDVPEQGAKGVAASLKSADVSAVAIEVSAIGAKFEGALSRGVLKGNFLQAGMKFPLELTQKALSVVNRPQTPIPPFPYATRDVSFVNSAAKATFAGTLTYPIGYEVSKSASTPVALLVTGSGPQNRDEEVFDHRPFAVIADYFARHGIATLRYDDRGVGESKGGLDIEATTADFADDAAAGIAFLRSLGEFGKVGVVGHSEGGTIAFMLGSRKAVDFVVSLAGPGASGDKVLLSQLRRQIKLSPMAALVPDLDEAAKMAYEQTLKTSASAWLNAFVAYDPSADIGTTVCPVLALIGSLDSQVIADVNLPPLEKALANNKNAKVIELEGLNHLFQHCKTGAGEEYYNIEETFSPEALAIMTEWIVGLR